MDLFMIAGLLTYLMLTFISLIMLSNNCYNYTLQNNGRNSFWNLNLNSLGVTEETSLRIPQNRKLGIGNGK